MPQAQVAVLSLTPGRPIGAEDIRDLQGTTPHGGGLRGRQPLQGADHLAQQVSGLLCRERRGIKLLVPEQYLYHADIHLLFQKVRGETVAQRVHRDALVDARRLRSCMDCPAELTGAELADRVQTRKQPSAIEHLALGAGDAPPSAQALE